MSELTKIDGYMLGPVNQWETDLYGFEMRSGVSDFIFNHMKLIIDTKDKSDWAYEMLECCFDLLQWGQRWPNKIQDEIPEDRQCKTRLCSLINKTKKRIAKRLGLTITAKFRSQGDMTKDPYIASIACAVEFGLYQFVESISIPRYLYRPTTWTWHKYLKNPTDKNERKYIRAEQIASIFKPKDFVTVLIKMRKDAAVLRRFDLL